MTTYYKEIILAGPNIEEEPPYNMTKKLKMNIYIFRCDTSSYQDGMCVLAAYPNYGETDRLLGQIKEKHLRRSDDDRTDSWWWDHAEDLAKLECKWRLVDTIWFCIDGEPRILGVCYHEG